MGKSPWTAAFRYTDKNGNLAVARGKTFVLEGEELELFPIGALCGVLGRSHKAIYKWEKELGFPPALYRVQEADQKGLRVRCNRWYSRRQLAMINVLYNEVNKKKKVRFDVKRFVERVRGLFYVIDRVKGRTNEDRSETSRGGPGKRPGHPEEDQR